MHAIRITAHGGPEVLTPADVVDPRPGPGDVLVAVEAAGVNYIDTYLRTGTYPRRPPFVPGLEGAGAVTAVGATVTDVAVGDRVAFCDADGTYAEQVAVPAGRVVVVPDALDTATAAAALLQGLTAHYLVHDTHPVVPGDTVLVHAAAGGMGRLLCQMAAAAGATVIATTSSAAKDDVARAAGAHHTLRYADDLPARVRYLTGDAGVAVVYDGVGASTFDASLASLRRRGVLALYGAASGPVPPVDPQRLNSAGSVYLTRPTLAHHVATTAELRGRADAVLGAVAKNELGLHVGGRYALDDAASAHRDLEGRRTTGKLLLIP